MKKRVVVTGVGLVTPLGVGTQESWEALIQGKSGVSHITRFDAAESSVRIAAEVKGFDAGQYVDRKEIKRLDKFIQYSVAAATMAMESSGLTSYPFNGERAGTLIGSGIGGFEVICNNTEAFLTGGYKKISPFLIPGAIINMASGIVSIKYKLLGPNSSVVTACTTGTHAIGDATKIIERGDADIMVCGGSEAPVIPVAIGGFANMRALSRRNDEPEKASRPFDKDRDGFVLGEGAAVLVLESLEHALNRGAEILAEVAGYGLTGDAYHITTPDETASGAIRCMNMALKDAGIAPEEVDYINAHGTSTEYNDKLETKAIKTLFGAHAYKLKVSSTKSMTGHMLGAAGAAEAVFTILAIKNSIIPPTINLDNPDPECDLDYVPHKAISKDIRYAISNSFGFGGTNGSVLLKKYD